MSFSELKEIENGAIVAVSTRLGFRLEREEVMVAAMWVWEQAVIEKALGDEAARVATGHRSMTCWRIYDSDAADTR